MAHNEEPFIPKSFKQIQKDYLETPFWISQFGFGSQITIVENIPATKPFRFKKTKSTKFPGDYVVNLIRITDGYTEKDLEVSKKNTEALMLNIPGHITNLKGVTLANNNGRWEFVCQTDESMNDGFKHAITQPVSPEEQKDRFLKKMCEDMSQLNKVGISISADVMLKIADSITPGDAMGLISAAKTKGMIYEEKPGIFKVT